jgi:hypothetical protein
MFLASSILHCRNAWYDCITCYSTSEVLTAFQMSFQIVEFALQGKSTRKKCCWQYPMTGGSCCSLHRHVAIWFDDTALMSLTRREIRVFFMTVLSVIAPVKNGELYIWTFWALVLPLLKLLMTISSAFFHVPEQVKKASSCAKQGSTKQLGHKNSGQDLFLCACTLKHMPS